jgi:hypothetical protein
MNSLCVMDYLEKEVKGGVWEEGAEGWTVEIFVSFEWECCESVDEEMTQKVRRTMTLDDKEMVPLTMMVSVTEKAMVLRMIQMLTSVLDIALFKQATILATLGHWPEKPEDAPK